MVKHYEMQKSAETNRMCGAAALSMVYRSLGKTISQSEIWPRIAKPDSHGTMYSRSYLLCADALNQGFHSIIIKAKDPVNVLKLCNDNSVRVILNHRLRPDSSLGHYTVLFDISSRFVIVNDPQFGPKRKILHQVIRDLWLPKGDNCEITGNILIAISKKPCDKTNCCLCNAIIPDSIECPNCNKHIPLQPKSILGCVRKSCSERTWTRIFCSSCSEGLSEITAQS